MRNNEDLATTNVEFIATFISNNDEPTWTDIQKAIYFWRNGTERDPVAHRGYFNRYFDRSYMYSYPYWYKEVSSNKTYYVLTNLGKTKARSGYGEFYHSSFNKEYIDFRRRNKHLLC